MIPAAAMARFGGLSRGSTVLHGRRDGLRLRRQGSVENATRAAEEVEVLSVLADAIESHVPLIRQADNLVLLLLDELLGVLELLVEGLVLLDGLLVPVLDLEVFGLGRLGGSAELSTGLPGMLGEPKCVHLASDHLELHSRSLRIFIGLEAEEIVLQLVVRRLHLELCMLGNASLQHASELIR